MPRNVHIAIELVSTKGKVTTRRLAERAGIFRPTAAGVLKGLVGEGMLAWHGKSERDAIHHPKGIVMNTNQKSREGAVRKAKTCFLYVRVSTKMQVETLCQATAQLDYSTRLLPNDGGESIEIEG